MLVLGFSPPHETTTKSVRADYFIGQQVEIHRFNPPSILLYTNFLMALLFAKIRYVQMFMCEKHTV